MKKLLILAIAVSALAFAGMAYAQPQPGDLGIFFTPTPTTGTDAVRNGVTAFVPFNVYVLTYSVPGGMEAYEFAVTVPAGAIFTGNPARLLPVGSTDFGVGDDNFIVGTGGICQGASGWFALVTYQGMMFLAPPANDLTLCLAGATPSSFANGRPGYLVCDSPGNLQNLGSAYAGCAIINRAALPEPVPADATSFGALKAAY